MLATAADTTSGAAKLVFLRVVTELSSTFRFFLPFFFCFPLLSSLFVFPFRGTTTTVDSPAIGVLSIGVVAFVHPEPLSLSAW